MNPAPAPPSAPVPGRVAACGKGLRIDGARWFLNGVCYGPFRLSASGQPFPADARLDEDFRIIREMGFNCVRLYDLPSDAVLSAAVKHGLRLLAGIPWTDHVDFLRDAAACERIKATVRSAAARLGERSEIAALLVGNELEATLVRWMGAGRVKRFIEDLIDEARSQAPHCLVSYATYPPTEYLLPENADFLAVNVYLEQRAPFEKYLRRLQNLAGGKPLVITEFGIDTLRHGDSVQSEVMRWQRDTILRLGCAGNVWFSFTDEWHRGGEDVAGWAFGLTDHERRIRAAGLAASRLPDRVRCDSGPFISVVVCTRNGAATLHGCLKALVAQRYASREIIVVDDGSTDDVRAIAMGFADVRYERQEHAGLSIARNLGAARARGEIIAYTDDDCEPEEDWLTNLALAFDDPRWVAAGGPNLPPAPRQRMEASVAQAPGAPAQVLLSDQEAEHLPGCNLAIRKDALDRIGGFRPQFVCAGDDVDVCWRLREQGGALRFEPGAVVWHYRRRTMRAYWRQQAGYGRAEALLMQVHPLHFGFRGGARWRGLIYDAPAWSPAEGAIFHGPAGTGLFQVIYTPGAGNGWRDWFNGVLWVVLMLVCVALRLYLTAMAVFFLAASGAWCRCGFHRRSSARDRVTLWWLTLTQPVVREGARLWGMISLRARPSFRPTLPVIRPPKLPRKRSRTLAEMAFWSEAGAGRDQWLRELRAILHERAVSFRDDDGWRWFDLEVEPERQRSISLRSVTEYHGGGRRLTRVAIDLRASPPLQLFPIADAAVAAVRDYALQAAGRAGMQLCQAGQNDPAFFG